MKYNLVIETAAFIHGADNKNAARLTVPPLRGLLRYWLRAALIHDPERTKLCEEHLFGKASSPGIIQMRLEPRESKESKFLLPHHLGHDNPSPSPAMVPDDKNSTDLHIRFLGCSTSVAEDHRMIEALAFLASHLGGFGQRARRGAGSILFKGGNELFTCSGHGDLDFGSYKNHIASGLQEASKLFNWPQARHDVPSETPRLASARFLACSLPPPSDKMDEQSARGWIMKKLQEYKAPAWGLPYTRTSGDREVKDRRASPAWFSLTLGKDGWYLTLTLFPSGEGDAGRGREKIDHFVKNVIKDKCRGSEIDWRSR